MTIQDYSAGGESISLSEIEATQLDGVVFGNCGPTQNSLSSLLIPVLISGKVMLFRFVSGVPTEIPPTIGLNATFPALVVAS